MANKDHVNVVLRGAEVISEWRMKNLNMTLDLRGAALRRADFVRANLNGVDLCEADLEWADFRWADLIGADLSGANLARADFHKADLSGAKLRRADLRMANLEDANLSGADCSEAVFSGTRLLNTDLSGVRGLTTTRHPDRSTIDPETLSKSENLPIEFLRGCGLSDREIRTAIKGIVSSEVFSDFLEMASYLLTEGYKDAAAVMIGSVLEQNLKQLCQKYSVEVFVTGQGKPVPKKADVMNADLVKAGVYNKLDQKNITAWLDLRNKAAHGYYDEYTEEQVSLMLQSVSEFITRMQKRLLEMG